MSSPSDGHGDSDSDSDSVRNPAMPERVQWEYHTKGGWWRGCYQQKELEMAWKAWHKSGCPPNELCGVLFKGVLYNINFKKFRQTAHERHHDGTLMPARSIRSIRRIMVTHEEDTDRPYN